MAQPYEDSQDSNVRQSSPAQPTEGLRREPQISRQGPGRQVLSSSVRVKRHANLVRCSTQAFRFDGNRSIHQSITDAGRQKKMPKYRVASISGVEAL
jgi:hypothetical protein